jgi:hypothetical protein
MLRFLPGAVVTYCRDKFEGVGRELKSLFSPGPGGGPGRSGAGGAGTSAQ